MRKIFQTCENQIFENEVKEKIDSLKFGALSLFNSFRIFESWSKVLDKPMCEKVISRFKYDRFNYYAVRAYREYSPDAHVSAGNILMFEEEKYSDESIFKFFSKEPIFRSFYAESVLYFRELLNGNVEGICFSEFGCRANESSADSNSDADVYTDSLDKLIWELNHRGLKTADQIKSDADKPTSDQVKTQSKTQTAEQNKEQTAEQPDEQTTEQEDIEELAKKLSEFVHLYNTTFDKFKRLKG